MTPRGAGHACVVALALAACSAAPPPPPSATARFELGATPLAFDAAPFPGDFRRAADGSLAIGALPSSRSDQPVMDHLRALLSARAGFCATCAVYFPVDGVLDRASVPTVTAGLATDPVVLADVDAASPERGRLFPLMLEWNATLGLVAVRPARGLALHGRRTYAVALTSSLRATDGSALGASAGFEPRRAELTAGLALAGVDASRIVAATVYTTEDPTTELREARAAMLSAPVPAVVVDRVYHAGAELDDLLGVPSVDRPGIDVPPVSGTLGTRSIHHGTIALALTGRLRAPRIVTGSGVEVGELLRGADGRITAGPTEDVTFLLLVPSGVDLAHLPVVVHQHGFNASRTTGFAIGETAARAGFAVLSVDAYQHGDRAASAVDASHAIRGDGVAGADGFAETTVLDVSGRVFGISGVPADDALWPGYPLAAFVQFASDVMATIRFAREGDVAPLRAADAALATLAFDAARVDYCGNSMGSVVGTSVLVVEPNVKRAVLNVPPGSIVETLCNSPEFRPLTTGVFLPALGVTPRGFDEVNRRLELDPVVDLVRWALEPVDPLALSTHLLAERVDASVAPDVLFQRAMLDEVAWPPATASFLTAAHATRVTEYDPATHVMLEVQDQTSAWEPPYSPPLVRRATAIPVANPLVPEHAELEAFLRGTP